MKAPVTFSASVSRQISSASARLVKTFVPASFTFTLSGAKYFQNHVYLLLTLSALSQFPGYAAAIWLVERIGRKPTLAAFLLLGGLSGYAFAAADSSSMYVISLFFVGFFNLGAWGAVYPYTSELFPTRVRSSAFGLLEGVGKGAAIAGPYIFGNLSDATGGTFWPLTFVALVMAGGGIENGRGKNEGVVSWHHDRARLRRSGGSHARRNILSACNRHGGADARAGGKSRREHRPVP